jgi:serine/threonine protein kinase
MIQKISEGTYGYIFCDKNYIYKISKSKEWDCSMIRETYLLSYLKDSNYVVNFFGCIKPAIGDKLFHFLIKEKLVDRIQGIILEKMDCNLKEYCLYLVNLYSNDSETLSIFFKKIFEKLLLALYDLQKLYILHNDLKLINILISYKQKSEFDFDLKLCDFGLGIQTSSFGLDDILCLGTCKYSAPEMRHKSVTKFYKKKPQYPQTLAMDLYSLGVVIVHVLCLLTNKKPLEKVTVDTFKTILEYNSNSNYFYSYNGFEFANSECISIIFSLLNENPLERESPRNILKEQYFKNKIQRFKFVETMKKYLGQYTYDFNKEYYIKFENKMKEWGFQNIPFEIYINIYHCLIQINYLVNNPYSVSDSSSNTSIETSVQSDKNSDVFSKNKLSFIQIFKLAIGWVLSIYHHRESQRYRKMISSSSDKSKFKKFEYEYRDFLQHIKIIPFMSMFKSCEIKNEIHRQKIFNYIFS